MGGTVPSCLHLFHPSERMNAHALRREVSALWKVYDSAFSDVLDLAISVLFPAPGQNHIGDWGGEDAIVGRGALALCGFRCDFIPWISVLAGQLVDKCGLDPHSTTVAQMHGSRERFFCVPCALEWRYEVLHIYTWRAAVW